MMLSRAFARQYGAYLALAAVLLQLALSFAHVPKHDFVLSASDSSDVVSVGYARPTLQAAEQLPARLADDDDHCPICFSNFLLSNSSIPDGSANQRSLQFAEIDRAFNPVSDLMFRSRHAAFRSRAPPAA
ncbi:hypothetical protein JJB98_23490 [Bradyrhizobium diazoefficiens]|nr:hypothetical protein [Bradyrhizobium diazoefficiens]QQO22668.1 hypothetical protein JJB98_23490 [Bradyrhizobium diazoefficiens]